MTASAQPTPPTLVAALERAALGGNGVHFSDAHGVTTRVGYTELLALARRAATALRQQGVRPGDRVGLVLRTSVEFCAAFFGAQLLGAVPVPLYPPLRLGDLAEYYARTRRMLAIARCGVVVVEPLLLELLRPAVVGLDPTHLITLESLPDAQLETACEEADAPALVQFSSGTTGNPKGVRLTHRQVLQNISDIIALVLHAAPERADQRHVVVSWLPLYHDMGLVGCLLSAIAHGVELVLIPPEFFLADPSLWLRLISRFGGTVSAAPNFAFGYCASRIEDGELDGVDLSSWRLALNGAEPLSQDALSAFVARFSSLGVSRDFILPVYGLAEATLLVCAGSSGQPPRFESFDTAALTQRARAIPAADGLSLASVGRPIAGIDLEIRDQDERALEAGGVGRIFIRAPALMDGYEGEPALSPGAWLDTGDIGFIWEGELFPYARQHDLLVVRGQKHAPERLERAAEQVAGVRAGRSAAFAIPDNAAGTAAIVVVVERRGTCLADDTTLSAAVQRRVHEVTGLRPREVRVVPPGDLPRTSNGKVRRSAARQRFLEGNV